MFLLKDLKENVFFLERDLDSSQQSPDDYQSSLCPINVRLRSRDTGQSSDWSGTASDCSSDWSASDCFSDWPTSPPTVPASCEGQ